MLYYDNEWKICPFIAHYKSYGKPEFKYTNDKQWWIEFVNRWWHHTDLSFTDVNPTQAQQTRLDEVNNAGIPQGFGYEAGMYVESGLVVNPDNPHFAGFTQWPEALDSEKHDFRKQIDVIRDRHLFRDSIPYTFPGDTEPDGVQLRDERDRQNIQDNMIDAQSLSPETVMHFMPVSNNVKAMTAAQMLEMGSFLKGRGDSIYAAAWTKKGEVGAADTLEELRAVDLNAGWPED